jgi:hypothetical protein
VPTKSVKSPNSLMTHKWPSHRYDSHRPRSLIAKRDYEVGKATYDIEVQTKKAQSDLAYELQVRRCDGRLLTRAGCQDEAEDSQRADWNPGCGARQGN